MGARKSKPALHRRGADELDSLRLWAGMYHDDSTAGRVGERVIPRNAFLGKRCTHVAMVREFWVVVADVLVDNLLDSGDCPEARRCTKVVPD